MVMSSLKIEESTSRKGEGARRSRGARGARRGCTRSGHVSFASWQPQAKTVRNKLGSSGTNAEAARGELKKRAEKDMT